MDVCYQGFYQERFLPTFCLFTFITLPGSRLRRVHLTHRRRCCPRRCSQQRRASSPRQFRLGLLRFALLISSRQPYSHLISSPIMAPVVLESPAMNMHNNTLSAMSRLQFNGHIHTPPASDHSRNDDETSPVAASAPLPPMHVRNGDSPFPLDPVLKERTGDNVDGVGDQNDPPATSELACTNCGTVNTPQWRRGDDGKSICNACGESSLHSRSRSEYFHRGCSIYALHSPSEASGSRRYASCATCLARSFVCSEAIISIPRCIFAFSACVVLYARVSFLPHPPPRCILSHSTTCYQACAITSSRCS